MVSRSVYQIIIGMCDLSDFLYMYVVCNQSVVLYSIQGQVRLNMDPSYLLSYSYIPVLSSKEQAQKSKSEVHVVV